MPDSPRPADAALRSCPFCGCSDHLRIDRTLRDGYTMQTEDPDAFAFNIHCPSCGATGGWAKSESGARRWWNMREWKPGASRLEGEGRDAERLAKAVLDLWDSRPAVIANDAAYFAQIARQDAKREKVLELARAIAPASSPQPTTTCRDCGRTTGLVRLVPPSPTPEGRP